MLRVFCALRFTTFPVKAAVRAAIILSAISAAALPGSAFQDEKKDDKKRSEPYTIKRITQGFGLYQIGPVSPDRMFILLLGQKPDRAPNLYLMDLKTLAIRPPLTDMKLGVATPCWSPDSMMVAFAGYGETASFSDLYTLDLRTARLKQITSNNFTDKEPVFSPDGKRVFFATDESPLPDAAFGILHIASVAVAGGKSEYFTEDEVSTTLPGLAPDGKSLLLVKVNDASGRHSLWQYGLDGKPERNLTGQQFARIMSYASSAQGNLVVIWGQEESERQDDVYILDLKTGETRVLPNIDSPKSRPAISPNGQRVAFVSLTEAGSHIFSFDRQTARIEQLTVKGGNSHSPVFITDDQIMFGSDRDRDPEVFIVDLAAPRGDAKKKD